MSTEPLTRAAVARAVRQRRERFTRKRSESAARELWTALVTRPDGPYPKWRKLVLHMMGIQLPKCTCVQCAADAFREQAELEMLRHAKKAF